MSYLSRFEEELSGYMPPLTKRDDFDEFWKETLETAGRVPLNPESRLYDFPSPHVKVYDIAFNGFDETRIHGWYLVPAFLKQDKFPCLVHYHGFTGDRGMPADFMQWVMMGVAVLSVDCRQQCGETGDHARYTHGSTQSVVCHGILDKYEYYFRAVYMDCVKAVDFACSRPETDAGRIIIEGGSQGGALGMAVCALDHRPWLAMLDVPSNSDIEKRVEEANGSFSAVTDYLKAFPRRVEKVFETLSYFDTMNMADRIQCPVLASVGLKDNVCPARMYFASYNRIRAPREIRLYPFNGHEGGGRVHNEVKLRFLRDHMKGEAKK